MSDVQVPNHQVQNHHQNHKPICHIHNHKECPACVEIGRVVELYRKQLELYSKLMKDSTAAAATLQQIIDLQKIELDKVTKLIGDCPISNLPT